MKKNSTSIVEFNHLNYLQQSKTLLKTARNIEAVFSANQSTEELLILLSCYLKAFKADKNDPQSSFIPNLSRKVLTAKTLADFYPYLVAIERLSNSSPADHEFIPSTHEKNEKKSTIPLSVIVDNWRSAFNVGSLLRSSDGLGVSEVILCGYTATPEHPQVKKTALGSENFVNWTYKKNTLDVITEKKKAGFFVIALETIEKAHNIESFCFPKPCAVLLGNERHGLHPDLISKCDATVKIPLSGKKSSLNAGVAFSLLAYAVRTQWQ